MDEVHLRSWRRMLSLSRTRRFEAEYTAKMKRVHVWTDLMANLEVCDVGLGVCLTQKHQRSFSQSASGLKRRGDKHWTVVATALD